MQIEPEIQQHPPRGRGYTDIFIYVGSGHFFGFKILNFNFFLGGGGVQKTKYFLGYEDFVDFFGGSSQFWTILKVLFLCILGSLLKVIVQNGDIFGGC